MPKLTAKFVENLKYQSTQATFTDAGYPLAMVVGPKSKTWIWRGRVDGKSKKQKLGTYPEMGLDIARAAALKLKAEITPDATVKPEPEEVLVEDTMNHHWDRYDLETSKRLKASTIKARANIYKVYFRDDLGLRALKSITRSDIKNLHKRVSKKSATGNPSIHAANHCVAYINAFLNWCVDEELIENNPGRDIRKNKVEAREVVISDEQLIRILANRRHAGLCADLLELVLRTGCRVSEICNLKWGNIDFVNSKIRLFTGQTKNSKHHDIHLTESGLALLPQRGEDESIDDRVFKVGKDSYKARHRQWRVKANAASTDIHIDADWNIHDFRGTMATWVSSRVGENDETIYDGEVVMRLLNHQPTGVTAKHYNQNAYWPQRRRAIMEWNQHIDNLKAGVIKPIEPVSRDNILKLENGEELVITPAMLKVLLAMAAEQAEGQQPA